MSWIDDYKDKYKDLPPVEDDLPFEDERFEEPKSPFDMLFKERPLEEIVERSKKAAFGKMEIVIELNNELVRRGVEDKEERYRIIEIIFG